ncbi:MAG: hypothetical protein IT581_06490 [Verrucomicrobiales bacterium]|nr:hypothetical protein [Verrucomicrobiales bacterium]
MKEFYSAIADRGLDAGKLARRIRSNRAHVTLVLNNTPGRGGHTRKKLAKLLTPEELKILNWKVTDAGKVVVGESVNASQPV